MAPGAYAIAIGALALQVSLRADAQAQPAPAPPPPPPPPAPSQAQPKLPQAQPKPPQAQPTPPQAQPTPLQASPPSPTAPASAAAKATLRGRVVDERGAPQAGVTVIAADQLVLTDDDGRFELVLPAGQTRLELSAPWLSPHAVTEALAAGAQASVVYTVRAAAASSTSGGGEVVEIEDRAPIEPGRQRVDADVARRVPGTSGDVLKVVESLAGVARPAPGKAELVVWGAAPKDTQVLVDGVPVPSLYHAGGWRAALGGELVTELALEPGAFGPRYGGAIGGIIAVTTDAPAGDGATVAVDLLDAGGSVHRQLGKTRLAVTGRWSYLDRMIDLAGDALDDAAAELVPVPAWADASAIAATPIGDGEGRVFALGSRDRLTRTVDSDDPAERKQQELANDVARAGASWRGPAAGGTALVTVYAGFDRERTELRFGEVPAALRADRWLGGARAEHVSALDEAMVLTLGAEAKLSRDAVHRDGSLGTPAREGDVAIFGQPPGDDVASDDWVARTGALAAYAALDHLRGGWTFSPGLRLDGFFLDTSRSTPKTSGAPELGFQRIVLEPQPRLAARYRRGDASFTAQAGLYAQPRQAGDASAVFGTPSLTVERAAHVATGGGYRLGPLTFELTAYARVLYDLVARHPSATPPATGALTHDGTGNVLGAQLVVKLAPWRGLVGWISYGASRSVRKDSDMAELRRFDHDQPHLVTMVAGWQRGRWSLGARVRVASGEPRTEVIGAFTDARSGRYQPILGEHNGIRLPLFVQADARAERQFSVGGGELALYLELQNASSRRNAEEIVYSADYGDRGYITGLPILTVLGARWQR